MGRLKAYTTNAVAIGTTTSSQGSTNPITFSHTVDAGSNLALLVLIGVHQGIITAVTWNGVALTKINSGRSNLNECGDAWILINPTPATGNVVITGSSWKGARAINLSNVAQTYTITNAIDEDSTTNSSNILIDITPGSSYNTVFVASGCEAVPTVQDGLISLGALQGQSFENFANAYIRSEGTDLLNLRFSQVPNKRYGVVAVSLAAASVSQTQLRSTSSTRTASGTRTLASI